MTCPDPTTRTPVSIAASLTLPPTIGGGVTTLPAPHNTTYDPGGLALLDLKSNRILHEIPFSPTTNHSATRNPVALETTPTKLRLFTAPDDGEDPQGTELQIYEAPLG